MPKNSQNIDKAIEEYKQKVMVPKIEAALKRWCWNILDAAIKARQMNPNAHNFTGNLLNSIVVCLYRERNPVMAFYASDRVPEAIAPKMKKRERRRVFFKQDYEGGESAYLPKIETDGGWGRDDAQEFFEEYIPKGNYLFDIVVAYPVEYANWVQMERQTTGILNTLHYAEKTGMTFMNIK